jgi:beta-lactamase regulating signal transducer with metallopeptidase domain
MTSNLLAWTNSALNVSGMNQIAHTVFLRALDSLVMGVVLAVFAALVLRVTGRQSAAARFAVWFSTLVAIAVLPWVEGELWPGTGAISQGSANAAAITLPNSWAVYFLIAWGVIVAIALIQLAIGLINLYALRKSFSAVDLNRLDGITRATLERHQLRRKIELCTSDRVSVPTAMGFFRPAVVIPSWLIDELSPAELNQILLHELAHLRRWDDWTNLAQKIVKAVFFFHPAVWWIEKKISLEREMACDDAVLAESANPRAYAECLVHLAEKSVIRRGVALAQAAIGKICQTSVRVAQILSVNRPAGSLSGWLPASLVAGFAVLSIVGVSRAPRLVAFDEARPHAVVAPLHGAARAANVSTPVEPSAMSKLVNAKFVPQPAKRTSSSRRNSVQPRALAASGRLRFNATAPRLAQFIQLTDVRENSAPAAPVFVVVEQDTYGTIGQTMYRLSVWRIVLVPPAYDSDSRIPRKET